MWASQSLSSVIARLDRAIHPGVTTRMDAPVEPGHDDGKNSGHDGAAALAFAHCHNGRTGNDEDFAMTEARMPLWEVFIRSRNGLSHKHVGSLHAADAEMALQAARDVYTRRGEGLSIWVVPSNAITASDPSEKEMMFEPTASKIYRHPTFYEVPEEVGHM